MDDWRECRLGELIEVKHGYAFLGQHFGNTGTHILLTPGNFFDAGGFKHKGDKEKWYSGPIPADYVLRKGDLLVAMTEQAEGLLGSSALIPRGGFYLHNQRLGHVLIRDHTAADARFLYHLFNHKPVRQQIRGSASGTKIRHTAPSRIAEVKVSVPPLLIQRRIAGILSAYDELMENCQRRIRILEEMARALYREWFVRFRFPGHEQVPRVDSPLGPIPKGWVVKKLGELADGMRRNVPKGELNEPQPYVGLEHIPRCSLALDAWETTTDLGSNKLEFKKGEVLFGKIRPYFHKVSVAPFDGLCSADTIVIRARRPEHYAFVVACVSSDDFVAHATATSNGSKMPRANWHVLEEYSVVIPTSEIAARFSRLMCDVIAQQQTLIFKIQNLRRTRDLLLPRLLSGQVSLDVSAVEDVAEPTAPAPPLSQTDLASEEPALRAAEEAPPYRVERSGHGLPPPAEPADEAPLPIDQIDRTAVLQVIRQVFSEGPPRERDAAIRDVARALGYRRTGARIHAILHTDLLTAVRRGILENTGGTLRLLARSITDYERDFLKQQFLAAIGRPWIDRDTATRDFCRWLGFARTGPLIEDTARSLIHGLLREGRLEASGAELIRRV